MLFILFCAFGTDTFYYIFCLLGPETFWQWNGWNAHIGQTEGAMAYPTGEVNMSHTVACVVNVTYTVFLRTAAIIDIVQQVGLAEQCQCAEERRTVYCGQCGFKIG